MNVYRQINYVFQQILYFLIYYKPDTAGMYYEDPN